LPKRIAVVGSSGGNLFVLGGDDPEALISETVRQSDAANIEISHVQFVAAKRSMDSADGDVPASLWSLREETPIRLHEGTLEEMNGLAREMDGDLARMIEAGEIDALVLVSADPDGVNQTSVEAAASRGLPASGTGGTSISAAQSRGLEFVAASGTTGTTNRTRAVSYISGLAREWGLSYRPVIGTTSDAASDEKPWRRISLPSIMISSLPAFIAMALVLAIGKIPGLDFMEDVFTVTVAQAVG
jgi:hypothetical protein